MKELIIIGGGPAGITAGIYAARKKLDGLLLTKDFIGQLGNAGVMENWPGEKNIQGPELLESFKSHLENYEFPIKQEEVEGLEKSEDGFRVITEGKSFESEAVIITTGRRPRPLNVPGEEEFVGKGVSYCVTCDGALFQDKNVAIVGGGNAGLEGALELSDYGKKVFILEIGDRLQGDEYLIDKVKDRKNIELLTKVKTEKIMGDDFVTGLEYENLSDGKSSKLEVEGVFIEIGSIPNSNFLNGLVELNDVSEIKIDPETCRTATEGLFAAGDVTDVRDKQVVVAAGEGCKALLSAYSYIKN